MEHVRTSDPGSGPFVAVSPAAATPSGTTGALLSTALLLSLAAFGLASAFELGWSFVPLALILFAPVAAFVRLRAGDHPHRRFGPANAVTLLRAGMAALIGASLSQDLGGQTPGGAALLWTLVAIAALALALDGLDGALARRTGLASRFGERFDMETDAFLMMVLCALAWAAGKAGAFVLLIGLMRYGFVLWGRAEPRLSAPLAPSLRRKSVCVLQIAALCLVLLPAVPPGASNALAAASLALLAWSFAVDVRALLRRPA